MIEPDYDLDSDMQNTMLANIIAQVNAAQSDRIAYFEFVKAQRERRLYEIH